MAANTGFTAKTRTVIMLRDAGHCRRCGGTSIGIEVQHRIARGMGGTSDPTVNDVSAGVLLCIPCHRWCEDREREQAYLTGWAIRHGTEAARQPWTVPLVDLSGRTFRLLQDGTIAWETGMPALQVWEDGHWEEWETFGRGGRR